MVLEWWVLKQGCSRYQWIYYFIFFHNVKHAFTLTEWLTDWLTAEYFLICLSCICYDSDVGIWIVAKTIFIMYELKLHQSTMLYLLNKYGAFVDKRYQKISASFAHVQALIFYIFFLSTAKWTCYGNALSNRILFCFFSLTRLKKNFWPLIWVFLKLPK